MRKALLLSTVAAALLLTAGAVSAQGMKQDEAPARAPAAQQNAPAEKVAPPLKPGAQSSESKKLPDTTGQASDADKPRALDKGAMDKGGSEKNPDKTMDKGGAAKDSSDRKAGADVKVKENTAQDSSGMKSGKSVSEQDRATTGQGAAGGSAKLSTEQRSKITTIFKQKKVESVHLNISVRVGTRVPESVHFYPVPVEVIAIYPEWRGYDYILVGDEILVIDPRTHEIVAILEA
jgi:Protein of unknown function (DUF1236)